MSICSTSVGSNDVPQTFPMLMSAVHFNNEQIILATGVSEECDNYFTGTNINGVGHKIGTYSTRWSNEFKPWFGSVTIKASKDV